MSDWAHRRGLSLRQRYAVGLIVASLVIISVGMWQQAEPGSQPAPPSTTDPAQAFHEPPRMTLGTRP